MNKLIRFVFVSFIASSMAIAQPAAAQIDVGSLDDLDAALQVATESYANGYVQPVTDAFGAGLNSALFRTADAGGGIIPKIDIYVGVSVTGTLMASSNRTFLPQDGTISSSGRTFIVDYDNVAVPTAFGDGTNNAEVRLIDEDTDITVATASLPPGAVDTPVAPLIIPQIGAGTLFGTDVMLRYLPETRLRGYGTIGVFGIGVRHSISQYIPMSPVDIAVQGGYNSISLKNQNLAGDVLDASGYAFNLQASKSLPVLPVTFYGGLQYETFNSEYAYQLDLGTSTLDVTLDQDATNSVRGLAGVSITLAVVRINADYSIAANDVVTVGIGVQL